MTTGPPLDTMEDSANDALIEFVYPTPESDSTPDPEPTPEPTPESTPEPTTPVPEPQPTADAPDPQLHRRAAFAPPGYFVVYENLTAATIAPSYMTFKTLTTYSPAACTNFCNSKPAWYVQKFII